MDAQDTTKAARPWPVIIMLAMLASVILAGFILAPRTEEDKLHWLELLGTTNHGELMNPPLEVTADLFYLADSTPWPALQRDTWKLMLVNQGPCGEACEALLLMARQVDTRLNRRAEQLERAWVNFGDTGLDMVQFAQAHPAVALLQADETDYQQWLAGSNLKAVAGPVLLLVNPIDVMQMYYSPDHEGVGLLEDLEHLMKLAN